MKSAPTAALKHWMAMFLTKLPTQLINKDWSITNWLATYKAKCELFAFERFGASMAIRLTLTNDFVSPFVASDITRQHFIFKADTQTWISPIGVVGASRGLETNILAKSLTPPDTKLTERWLFDLIAAKFAGKFVRTMPSVATSGIPVTASETTFTF
jgi:hypothetical protein